MTISLTPAGWPDDALARFGAADEIEISTRRGDGRLRAFVPIWIVSLDGNLYVRSYRGIGGAWYRRATEDPAGAIRAGGQQAEVAFIPVDQQHRDVLDAVSDAYRAKYARYGERYLQPMLDEPAVTATLQLWPHS